MQLLFKYLANAIKEDLCLKKIYLNVIVIQ